MPAAQTLSAKEVAVELKTDARTLRKFLREVTPKDEQPGQGGRWSFTKGDVKKLTKQFNTWVEKGAKAKAEAVAEATSTKKKGKKQVEEPESIEEVEFEDDIELSDLDPADDEIEDIEPETDELEDEIE